MNNNSLALDRDHVLDISINDVIGKKIAVLGITRSGKTNTAAVIVEELLAKGLPMTILDIEGEYWGLRERFDHILVAGKSPHVDIEISPDQAGSLAEFSINQGVPVILDVSDFDEDETDEFLLNYFKRLWNINFKKRRPYEIVLEEAHEFVPQGPRTPLKKLLTRITLRGGKRGFGIVLISQRSAKVEKDIVGMAEFVFLHRVVHPIDIAVYQKTIPLPSRQVEEMIAGLEQGQAIALYNNQVNVVSIRLRHTFHAGATPELDESILPALRKIDEATLKALQAALGQSNSKPSEPECDELRRQIKALESRLKAKDTEIEKLKARPVPAANTATKSPVAVHMRESPRPTDATPAKQLGKPNGARPQPIPARPEPQPLPQAIRKQERQFEVLLDDLRQLPKFHRTMLKYLIDHEHRAFDRYELGRWIGIAAETIKHTPPSQLLELGLISRERHKEGFRYISTARNELKTRFPDLNIDSLIDRLKAACD